MSSHTRSSGCYWKLVNGLLDRLGMQRLSWFRLLDQPLIWILADKIPALLLNQPSAVSWCHELLSARFWFGSSSGESDVSRLITFGQMTLHILVRQVGSSRQRTIRSGVNKAIEPDDNGGSNPTGPTNYVSALILSCSYACSQLNSSRIEDSYFVHCSSTKILVYLAIVMLFPLTPSCMR